MIYFDNAATTVIYSHALHYAANVAVAFNAVASCSVDRVKLVVRP